MDATRAATEELLIPLRESIIDKPPFVSGVLQLPPSQFSLYYKIAGERGAARHLYLSDATFDELEQLTRACEPATFGLKDKDVLDETYRKAGKMDCCNFATPLVPEQVDLVNIVRGYLLEGIDSTRKLKVEQYKLNVYGEGSFFKPHVDTPRSEKMFGSLVIVFPSPHEGGALLIRHRDQEWTFDSAASLKDAPPSSIGYVAFFSDVEHEVAPVASGHRVTLTYNLHFDDGDNDDRPELATPTATAETSPAVAGTSSASAIAATATATSSPPQAANELTFRTAFETLLENPEFLPDGGTLGFGLRHVYQIKDGKLKHVYGLLKGSDAAVYRSILGLGFEPVLYLHYTNFGVGLIDRVPRLKQYAEIENPEMVLRSQGGVVIGEVVGYRGSKGGRKIREDVYWVTPETKINRQTSPFMGYGNQAELEMAYGDVCLVVRIGKAGERLAYTTIKQLKQEWKLAHSKGEFYGYPTR